jgi:hypothetical protein
MPPPFPSGSGREFAYSWDYCVCITYAACVCVCVVRVVYGLFGIGSFRCSSRWETPVTSPARVLAGTPAPTRGGGGRRGGRGGVAAVAVHGALLGRGRAARRRREDGRAVGGGGRGGALARLSPRRVDLLAEVRRHGIGRRHFEGEVSFKFWGCVCGEESLGEGGGSTRFRPLRSRQGKRERKRESWGGGSRVCLSGFATVSEDYEKYRAERSPVSEGCGRIREVEETGKEQGESGV